MLSTLHDEDPVRIGPYRLEARLASGRSADVYLGRSASGRPVAVKSVVAPLAADPTFRRRFEREVTSARRVSGLHVAALVDADTGAERPWIATAYVPGPTLREAVAAGPLPAPTVRSLGAGLAEGLASIHAAGLVHGSLNPDNVILAADGPRIIDFSLARALEHASTTTVAADPGPDGVAYLSPEQVLGQDEGPAGDVFSLGGVIHFAATGTGPFDEESPETTMALILREERELAALPDGLADVVAGCLARDPDARPAVPALLEELTAGRAEPDTWLPTRVSDMVAELTEVIETGAATAVLPERPAQAAARPRPSRRLLVGAVSVAAAVALVGGGLAVLSLLDRDEASAGPQASASGEPATDGGSGKDPGAQEDEKHTIVLEAFYQGEDAEGLEAGVMYSGWRDSNTALFSDHPIGEDGQEAEPISVKTPWKETIQFTGPIDSIQFGVFSSQDVFNAIPVTCRVTLDGEMVMEATTDRVGSPNCSGMKTPGSPDDQEEFDMMLMMGDTCKGTFVRNPPECG